MKEGRKYPGEDADVGSDSEDEDIVALAKKGRQHNRKRKGKTVLVVEESGNPGTTKKAKVDDPDKEIAGCNACWALADKPEGSDKQYCKIHRTKGRDLQNCSQVEQLMEKRGLSMKDETKRRDKMVLRDLVRSAVAEKVATAKTSNKKGLLEAATRKRVMMIMMMTTSPASTSFRKLQRLCVLMEAHRCILPTINLNNGRMRSM